MRPLPLMFVEASSGFGGSTVAMARLVGALDRSAFRPVVVVSHERQREHFRRNLPADAELKLLPVPRPDERQGGDAPSLLRSAGATLRHARRTMPYARELARLARARGCALVHLNNTISVNAGGILAARRLGVPCVLKQHGYEFPSWDTRLLARCVSRFMADSEDVAHDLERLGVPRERIAVTYCPIDVAAHEAADPAGVREELRVPAGAPLAGMVGCLLEWKGQHVFLEAAEDVLRRVPAAWAVVVGAPPGGEDSPYARRLREQARASSARGRIVFAGHRDDVPRVLKALDVCVHASVLPEPFGMVIGEAMAARVPVVASRAGGPVEIVQHGVSGLLTTPGDPRELADAVVRLLTDRDLARRMADAGRRRVEERFSLAGHVALTEEVYRSVLRQEGSQ